jgi:hypothetical protein
MSIRVSEFIKARNNEIREITQLLNLIRQQSLSLESIVGRMSQFTIINLAEVKPSSLMKLCSEIEYSIGKAHSRTFGNVQVSPAISP